jgi:glucose-1-phosphate thymidylyltransferase
MSRRVAPVVVGVVPAAGRAKRLQPLAGSKELIWIRGRPVIDHLLERLGRAEPDEIRVVTRPEKVDVVRHVEELGLRVVLGRPRTVAESLAHGLAGLGPDDIVLFGFPDTIWEPVDGFVSLRRAVEGGAEITLGVFAGCEPERSDVVVLDETGTRVKSVHVKDASPPTRLIWGCLAARVGALDGVADRAEPGHLLDGLARTGRVAAVDFGTEFVDVGTPEALAAAGGAR